MGASRTHWVSRELLARAWAAEAGPDDAPLTIDLDSTICETHGLAKEGARHHGYTGARGYHPLLARAWTTVGGTGDVLMSRLREGRANAAQRAASPGIFPSAGPGRPRSVAPWADSEPCHSRPDGAAVAGSTHRPTERRRQLAPTRSARDNSCLPPIDAAPHGRPAAIIGPVRSPHAALITIYWNLAWPRSPSLTHHLIPVPIIPGINDRDVSLRWIRDKWGKVASGHGPQYCSRSVLPTGWFCRSITIAVGYVYHPSLRWRPRRPKCQIWPTGSPCAGVSWTAGQFCTRSRPRRPLFWSSR